MTYKSRGPEMKNVCVDVARIVARGAIVERCVEERLDVLLSDAVSLVRLRCVVWIWRAERCAKLTHL